jgi:6-phospho-beta-glucosidase
MLAELKAEARCRGQVCQEIEAELLSLYRDPKLAEKPAILEQRGGAWYSEVAVSLVQAIAADRKEAHVVNTRNGDCLEFMAADDVVEVSCLVDRDGAHPLPIRNFANRHIVGLMRQVKEYEKLTVEAALTGSRSTALHALFRHPLVGDYELAKACLDELLEAHRPWLPRFFNPGRPV